MPTEFLCICKHMEAAGYKVIRHFFPFNRAAMLVAVRVQHLPSNNLIRPESVRKHNSAMVAIYLFQRFLQIFERQVMHQASVAPLRADACSFKIARHCTADRFFV